MRSLRPIGRKARRAERGSVGLDSVFDTRRQPTPAFVDSSRSRPVYNRFNLRRIQWKLGGLDRSPGDQGGLMDEKNHLAKVRVTGSNPVVRSKKNTLVRPLM